MTTQHTLPLGLRRFELRPHWPIVGVQPHFIVAKTKAQAWRKFCHQRFGALKPCRQEWNITATKESEAIAI